MIASHKTDSAVRYRHYKGGIYEFVGLGKHSETMEELVIYRSVGDPAQIWVRPKDMFFEEILFDGNKVMRFTRIKE